MFPAWEHWVVRVPEANDVHAIVMDRADAAEIARAAAALILEIDPVTITISLVDQARETLLSRPATGTVATRTPVRRSRRRVRGQATPAG